jgi:hypothetical protein
LGFKARYGAWLIVISLVPITIAEPMMRQMLQIDFFMHKLALLGQKSDPEKRLPHLVHDKVFPIASSLHTIVLNFF